MYIYSEQLKKRIEEIAALVKEKTNGVVHYEEFIAIPYFGYIILRFDLETEHYTIDDLDHYEELIYDIVGDEFLVDFMGIVYKKLASTFLIRKHNTLKWLKNIKMSQLQIQSMQSESVMMLKSYWKKPALILVKMFGKYRLMITN